MHLSTKLSKKLVFIIAIALVLLYTLPQIIQPRELWFSDEVRHASSYYEMHKTNNYFTLSLNGERYTDKPPVYFWFLSAVENITGFSGEKVFFTGLLLSVLAFVSSTYFLAYVCAMPISVIISACCMAITSALPLALSIFSRMDMLFAATINFAFIFFFLAWKKEKSIIYNFIAFTLMGIACLIKGPFALAFPLLASIVYLFWCKRFKRFFSKDLLIGSLGFFIIIFIWLGGIYFSGQFDYLIETFQLQIAGRAVNSWRHAAPVYYYFIFIPLLLLPYSLIPLCIINPKEAKSSSKNILTLTIEKIKNSQKTLAENSENRQLHVKDEDLQAIAGKTWLYCIVCASLFVLTIVSAKLSIYSLPLFPAFFVLLSQSFITSSENRGKYFHQILISILFLFSFLLLIIFLAPYIIKGIELFNASLVMQIPSYLITLLNELNTIYAALAFLLSGFALSLIAKKSQKNTSVKVLLSYTISFGLCVWVIIFSIMPQVSPYLSTKSVALEIKEYINIGYNTISYKVYPGTFTYYSENILIETDESDELDSFLAQNNKAVILTREKYYLRLIDAKNPYISSAKIISETFIADSEYILLLHEVSANNTIQESTEQIIEDIPTIN